MVTHYRHVSLIFDFDFWAASRKASPTDDTVAWSVRLHVCHIGALLDHADIDTRMAPINTERKTRRTPGRGTKYVNTESTIYMSNLALLDSIYAIPMKIIEPNYLLTHQIMQTCKHTNS